MGELKIDNPALRLLDILEKGLGYSNNTTCRVVWNALLETEDMQEHRLLSRLARVMELPERIIQVRDDHFSSLRSKSDYWRVKVDTAFTSQALNGYWETFKTHIDERTLSELSLLSDIFDTRGAHAGIGSEEIGALLVKITELRSVNATMFDRYLPFSCPLNTFVTDAVRFSPFHHH